MRNFPKHRAVYCYLVLSLWIFLLIAGMYKYMIQEANLIARYPSNDDAIKNFPKSLKSDPKTKKILRVCNRPEDITAGSEGLVGGNFTLEGVLLVVRHGDRGPLSHVRNVSAVDCGPATPADRMEFQYYAEAILNSSHSPGFLQFLGPFHSFPLVPPAGGVECNLGQLTGQGIIQLRRTGYLLHKAYATRLAIDSSNFGPSIAIYCTRYRRTFQSALALVHAFLSPLHLSKAAFPFHEAHSLAFCFSDCACPAAEVLRKQAESETSKALYSHPAVAQLTKVLSKVVFDEPLFLSATDPRTVHDSLLVYACHNSKLPCVNTQSKAQYTCVHADHVTSLFTYVDWEARRLARSLAMKRVAILRAYGLLRHMVGQLLRLVSADRRQPPSPRLVLYSGHDRTLQYLAGALGISSLNSDTALPPYASRIILELYKDKSSHHDVTAGNAMQYLFRLLFNGRDVTSKLHFCNTNLLRNLTDIYEVSSGIKRVSSASLCPLEAIVRYLHDDYFSTFNTTNFKDSCFMHF